MKLCKDCKHFGFPVRPGYANEYALGGCDRMVESTNMINGDISYVPAQAVREDVSLCGPGAAWWEEKNQLIK